MTPVTGHSKVLTTSTQRLAPAVSQSSDSSGPTGSKRTYPKGKGSAAPNPSSFNPMNSKASTYGLEGK